MPKILVVLASWFCLMQMSYASVAVIPVPSELEIISFNTGSNGEMTDRLLSKQDGSYRRSRIFRVDLGELYAGDVIQVNSEVQGTNDSGVNTMFKTQLILSDNQYALYPADSNVFHEISKKSGYNVTPDMHHGMHSKSATFVVPEYMPSAYRLAGPVMALILTPVMAS